MSLHLGHFLKGVVMIILPWERRIPEVWIKMNDEPEVLLQRQARTPIQIFSSLSISAL